MSGFIVRVFLALILFPLSYQYANAQNEPRTIVEWEKRQNADERMRTYGPDIFGDGIDPHTGTIGFSQTDVSLPGNFSLEVALTRRISQGYLYAESVNAEFGDWEHAVPRIVADTLDSVTTGWAHASNRCTNDFDASFPDHVSGSNFT